MDHQLMFAKKLMVYAINEKISAQILDGIWAVVAWLNEMYNQKNRGRVIPPQHC